MMKHGPEKSKKLNLNKNKRNRQAKLRMILLKRLESNQNKHTKVALKVLSTPMKKTITYIPSFDISEEKVNLKEQLAALYTHFVLAKNWLNDRNTNLSLFQYNKIHAPKPVSLTLENVNYHVVGSVGRGQEGNVYKIIKDQSQEVFALKVYNYKNDVLGDKLIFENANESRKYLNMPLVVNMQFGYSISPLLGSHNTGEETNRQFVNEMAELDKKLNVALEKDGLSLGDNLNAGNYVTTKDGSLKRIDFSAAKKLTKNDHLYLG